MSILSSKKSRIVGVDVGTKRVGIAVADPLRLFAQTRGTYPPEEALEALRKMSGEEGIDTIVVGWPLTEEGTAEDATDMVESYVDRIREALGEVTVVREDERYTSEIAKDLLRRAGVSQPGRYDRGRVDAGRGSGPARFPRPGCSPPR
ncbi:MAG: Holliday junction resolvase RuvX [Bacteroidetes bacterium SW_7_64_58]|nr:MAG: Holliday junction resolvase RuvX [Bacteroidetes bacterium SW_7_64_58]